ncbi:hypothetical protein M408DRAFT_12538 [Serendipita vermifera MAFF 305830]|uniref:Uncharacterized protein n=1 Tax=Serendipita vermifera MAFF 305830 TaxID=933852 RepID=A0A0C3AQH1_SERVB|nr:hypothetical protein M408DRAFT_12538 [Serendipita vermifera MAFF 305830]
MALSSAPITTQIQFLDIWYQSSPQWLLTISFPKLRGLACRDTNWRGFTEFLMAHSTIETMKLGVSANEIMTRLPHIASQVTTLHLVLLQGIQWGSCVTSPGAFPALKNLGVSALVGGIHPSELDTIVRTRCLPVNHPLSTTTDPSWLLEEFFIEVRKMGQYEEVDVYMQATKRIVESGSMKKIYLSWPTEQANFGVKSRLNSIGRLCEGGPERR